MSVPHFQRLFKAELGTTPMAFLNDLRLEKAREFLADANCFLRIKEIGLKVGLVNNSHFTTGFKKKFGMTPSQFQAHHAKMHQSLPPDEKK